MNGAVDKNRRSKREVITIDDDDSLSEQPAAKSKKIDAEPVASPDVIELQLKNRKLEQEVVELKQAVTKLEKNFQGACRIAGEAQARVQFLENLIDTKPNLIDDAKNKEREAELWKKIEELTAKLAQYEGPPQQPPMQQLQQTPAEISTVQQPRRKSSMVMSKATEGKERVAAVAATPPVSTRVIPPLENAKAVQKNSTSTHAFLPHDKLPGSEENVVGDEQTRWAYGESQKRRAVSSVTTSGMDKIGSTPKRQKINDTFKELSPLPIQQSSAASLPPLLQQNIPTAAQAPLLQQPQLNPAATTQEVTICAKLGEISKLDGDYYVYSQTEFAEITWKILAFRIRHKFNIKLKGEKDDAIVWSCPVTVGIQFSSKKSEEINPVRTIQKCFTEHSSMHTLGRFTFKQLNEKGYLINDSIMVTVVIKALPTK